MARAIIIQYKYIIRKNEVNATGMFSEGKVMKGSIYKKKKKRRFKNEGEGKYLSAPAHESILLMRITCHG